MERKDSKNSGETIMEQLASQPGFLGRFWDLTEELPAHDDPDFMAEQKDRAHETVRSIDLLGRDAALDFMEPGVREWLSEAVPDFLDMLVEDLRRAGLLIPRDKLESQVWAMVLRSFMLLPVAGPWPERPLMGIGLEEWHSWYALQFDIQQKGQELEGPYYRGLPMELCCARPDLDQALGCILDLSLESLGLTREILGEQAEAAMLFMASVGLDAACGQLLAWEELEPWPLDEGDERTARWIFRNMSAITRLLDDGNAEYLDPARMDAYMRLREQAAEPEVSREARFCRLLLARVRGVDNGFGRLPGAVMGHLCLAAREWAEAYVHYRQEAMAGDAGAMYALSALYGLGLGCEADEAKRVQWLLKAAEAGHEGARADRIGEGLGVEEDVELYFATAEKAALGDDSFVLGGLALAYAQEPRLDLEKALQWARRSYDKGNPLAMILLQHMNGMIDAAE